MRPRKKSTDGLLVHEIFYTLQGEGFYTGHPAVFIRLSGCNLACSFCDTEFESYDIMKEKEVVSKVKDYPCAKLVVITGGEPLLQDIFELCQKLIKAGFLVQIETNGTMFRELPKGVFVVCSPKFNSKQGFTISQDFANRVNAFKFVISYGIKNYSSVPTAFRGYGVPIYVQPMDEGDVLKNKKNIQLALSISLKEGYILSLQTHKMLEIK